MRIIHKQGFNADELLSWRVIVYRNIIESIQTLTQALLTFHMEFDNEDNNVSVCHSVATIIVNIISSIILIHYGQDHARRVLNYKIPGEMKFDLNPELITSIQKVWQDPIVPQCIQEYGHRFYLMDSAS